MSHVEVHNTTPEPPHDPESRSVWPIVVVVLVIALVLVGFILMRGDRVERDIDVEVPQASPTVEVPDKIEVDVPEEVEVDVPDEVKVDVPEKVDVNVQQSPPPKQDPAPPQQ